VDFAGWIGISLPADASHLQDWHQRATAQTA
jgi:glutathione S-transferase